MRRASRPSLTGSTWFAKPWRTSASESKGASWRTIRRSNSSVWRTRSSKPAKSCNSSSMIRPVCSFNWIQFSKHRMASVHMLRICRFCLKNQESWKNSVTRIRVRLPPCCGRTANFWPPSVCSRSAWHKRRTIALLVMAQRSSSFWTNCYPQSITCSRGQSAKFAATANATSKRQSRPGQQGHFSRSKESIEKRWNRWYRLPNSRTTAQFEIDIISALLSRHPWFEIIGHAIFNNYITDLIISFHQRAVD